ncbi:uncharacterized protein CBL_14129 [Carabus blaptoides fortunei]
MYKCVIVVALVATATFCILGISGQEPAVGISTQCLGCLCEAATNCNRTLTCRGNICGLFSITWNYWADAGKPTQPGETVDSPSAFTNCVNEPFCAARAVQGYMAKFGKDCNKDGKIDCIDYATIHKIGGYGCEGANLPEEFKQKLELCLQQVGNF